MAETNNKEIDALFSRFAAMYGHLWRSQFKDERFLTYAKKQWCEALSPYSGAVIQKAVSECGESNPMPPSMAQFVRACRDIKKRHQCFKPEPVGKQTLSVAEKHLSLMKSYL